MISHPISSAPKNLQGSTMEPCELENHHMTFATAAGLVCLCLAAYGKHNQFKL